MPAEGRGPIDPEHLAATARDALYVGVGLAVMAVQRLQAERRAWRDRAGEDGLAARLAMLDERVSHLADAVAARSRAAATRGTAQAASPKP